MLTARPQSVGYGQADSPAGLAGWLLMHPGSRSGRTAGFRVSRVSNGPLTAIAMSYQDKELEDWNRTVAMIGSADYAPAEDGTAGLTIGEQSE